jgi:hypothetical protein
VQGNRPALLPKVVPYADAYCSPRQMTSITARALALMAPQAKPSHTAANGW